MLNSSASDITVAITIIPTWRTAFRQKFITATHSFRAPSEFNFRESFISELLRSKGSPQKWNFYLFLSCNVTPEFGGFIGHLKPRKDRKMNGFRGIVPLIQETRDAKRIFNLENDRSNMFSSLTGKPRFINLLLYFIGGRELSARWECGIFRQVYDSPENS
ncbi:hypothetical protein CDAR_574481 [Caerostris darwini]|uniref:Uncharacterized protein n=1 Tax=Caerostris darwini TaxID=1538125 RepID=A0AAV4UIN2_9ARAC|nr:hypothetical protein CDAR_574481 [Caerostris darwini]